MIQVSYTIAATTPTSDPTAPLRLSRANDTDDAQRLTGLWPHRDLAAARRQVAAFLATLPADTPVRCNFTGRAKAASEWGAELRAPVTVTSVFEARHAIIEGQLVARVFGLYQLGESDIVLIADAASDVSEVYRFLTAWATFRLGAPEAPVWDRPFPWGWWLVSFAESDVGDAAFWSLVREALGTTHLRDAFDDRMESPAPHVVIEAADPGDPDSSYMIGATAALATAARQRVTAARLSPTTVASPSAQDAAGFCERLFDDDRHGADDVDFFAYREAAKGPLDSGWRLGCLEPDHVHDGGSLRIAPLARALRLHPGLVDYLTLPPGWVVTREAGAFWTNAPGQEESHREPDPEPAS